MEKRAHNFFAGPTGLPTEVLKEVQAELLNFKGTGVSVMEISHRSKEFQAVIDEAEADLKEILGLDDDYAVLFLQGGATHQFTMLPMNILNDGDDADYIVTGKWAERAHEEGALMGKANLIATSADADKKYCHLPEIKKEDMSDSAKYLHFTSNNTIFGTQWWEFPKTKPGTALVSDMSSDFLSREFDASKFDMIYAGAQKNIGPAGVTVVVIKKSFAEEISKKLPKTFDYRNQELGNGKKSTQFFCRPHLEYGQKRPPMYGLQLLPHQDLNQEFYCPNLFGWHLNLFLSLCRCLLHCCYPSLIQCCYQYLFHCYDPSLFQCHLHLSFCLCQDLFPSLHLY